MLGWLNVIEAHQKAGLEFPVNLLMCFEGMEENGSEGLDELIEQEAKKFFKDADCVCISDNYWLGTTKPCLTVPFVLWNMVNGSMDFVGSVISRLLSMDRRKICIPAYLEELCMNP